MAEFKIGDRVKIKDRPDWPSKPGYLLAGSEGVIARWSNWPELFTDYPEYVWVIIDKPARPDDQGRDVVLRTENLEKI
jgi:hypothetical protein